MSDRSTGAAGTQEARTAVRARITGRVQGVGYRAWCAGRARAHGLSGRVRNEADGSVSAVFAGPAASVEAMLAECRDGPPSAAVEDVAVDPTDEAPSGPFGQG
ncbi:MAG: acylphosphatase [Paracoccaceae bacterium]